MTVAAVVVVVDLRVVVVGVVAAGAATTGQTCLAGQFEFEEITASLSWMATSLVAIV